MLSCILRARDCRTAPSGGIERGWLNRSAIRIEREAARIARDDPAQQIAREQDRVAPLTTRRADRTNAVASLARSRLP